MSNLDNQPDPSRTEVQKGNAQAEVMRKLIQSKFPRTYRLLNGIRFQLPPRRQADYPNHEYAAYWDGQMLMDGLTRIPLKPSRGPHALEAHRGSVSGDQRMAQTRPAHLIRRAGAG
jgi:hypothetical protein